VSATWVYVLLCEGEPLVGGQQVSRLFPFHSDHDDEVASLASASGGFGSKIPTPRLPSKDWKTKGSPRTSPKLKRKSKKDDG
jgi:hypothetical protein